MEATRTTRLKWIPTRDISLVHIIPYRERGLSSDTANTVALILTFLRRIPWDARPNAGTHRGEKDFGRTYTGPCTYVCVYLDWWKRIDSKSEGEKARARERERERKRERERGPYRGREIPDRPRGDYTGIIVDPVGNLASMAPLFCASGREREDRNVPGRAGSAVETDNRSRFIRSENLSFLASVLRIRAGIITQNVMVIALGFVPCAFVKGTWDFQDSRY